nr:MAG TPA: hypothetical protein [Caudoviricetes sp.]
MQKHRGIALMLNMKNVRLIILNTVKIKQSIRGTGGQTMRRLIDADKLKADLEKAISKNEDMDCLDFLHIASVIDKQPTAYDPDKVVEQLEELKSLVPVNRILDDIVNEKQKELGMLIAYRKAIEIVKGGGVDGN